MTEIEVAFRSVERRVGDVRAHPQIDAARRSRNAWIMHRGTAVVGQIQSAVGDKRCVGSHSKRKRLTFSTPSRLTQARGYAGGIAAVSEPARSGERRGNPRVAGGGRVGRGGVGWTHVQVAGGKTTAVQYCDTGLPAESGVRTERNTWSNLSPLKSESSGSKRQSGEKTESSRDLRSKLWCSASRADD